MIKVRKLVGSVVHRGGGLRWNSKRCWYRFSEAEQHRRLGVKSEVANLNTRQAVMGSQLVEF